MRFFCVMKRRKYKSINYKPFYKDWNFYLIFFGVVFMCFIGYLFHLNANSNRRIFSISFIPLLLGVIYENWRLKSDWKLILFKALIAFVFSFLVFLPGKNERNYNFENHIEIWPFYFVGIFVFISMIIHGEKVVPKLTEGITFLLSISIIYWLIDINIFEKINWFKLIVILFFGIISLYSFFHAFTHRDLNKNSRLTLSICSSVIMIVFAVVHIFKVFKNNYIEDSDFLSGLFIGLQYFLLGVSSMYILQNMMMLIEYLPGRNHFYDKAHLKDIRKMNQTHIIRYSEEQVSIFDSLLAFLLLSGFYYLNYQYRFLPSHTAIWLAIIFFPYFVGVKNLISSNIK